jgi:hypothetical protein
MPKLAALLHFALYREFPKSQVILGYFWPQVLDGAQVNESKGKPLI